jgi:hypothetical protein
MDMYKKWQGILIAEGALVLLVLSLLGWQSWNTLSDREITGRNLSPRVQLIP